MENDKPKFGMQLAAGAANTLLGQVGGMIFGKAQDRRQLKQQEKLQKLQIAGNKELADYEQKLAMDMWDATNLPAQVDKAKEAGMSISALYGGKGAGGATTAGGSAGSASGTAAGDPNAGVGMGLQMASQLALMQAQKENIEADTANKKVDAAKKAGVDTDLVKADISLRGKQELLTDEQWTKAIAESQLANRSLESDIARKKAEQVGQELQNQLTDQNRKLSKEQTASIATKLAIEWESLRLTGEGLEVSERNMTKLTEAMLWGAGIQATGKLVDGIMGIVKGKVGLK